MILPNPWVVGTTRAEPWDRRRERKSDQILHSMPERILQYLGAAGLMQWNDLPPEIQRILFEDAASMGTAARRFQLKQQIAQFLRDHKNDA
jgi:hypothetical protein